MLWAVLVLSAMTLGLPTAAGAQAGAVAEDRVGADAAAVHCSDRYGFAQEPLAVAKSADGSEVLAEVSWTYGADGGCVLALDEEAQAVLRSAVSAGSQLVWGSALPDLSLGEPSDGDRAAAEHCFETTSEFALDPVDVAWDEDGSAALAQVKWQRHNAAGCYLVLNDNALSALRSAEPGLAVGWNHSCLLRVDRTLVCSDHTDVYSPASPPKGRFADVDVGSTQSCAVELDGTLVCWGHGENGYKPAAVPGGRFTAVAVGGRHVCAISDGGAISCLGDGRLGKTDAPPGKYTAISAGAQHSCAIRDHDAAVCWGDDSFGQANPPPGRFSAVAAGEYHTCAIRADRTLTCWGQGHPTAEPDETHSEPGDTLAGRSDVLAGPPAGEFIAVAAGAQHSCAIRADRTLACWGHANLGYGQADAPDGHFVSVAAGAYHSCGVRVDRTIACWGSHDPAVFRDDPLFLALAPIRVVYAVPAGVEPVPGRPQQIANTIAEVQEWFRDQTGGRHPLFARHGDRVSVAVVELSGPGANRNAVLGQIYQQLGETGALVVFGEGEFDAASVPYEGGGHSCAHGGRDAVMISTARCLPRYASRDRFGWLVAHELVHMLGAVPPCAPNYYGHGHLSSFFSSEEERAIADDGTFDIMHSWGGSRLLSEAVLDKGRDDYYGHGREDCYDIAANPLLIYAEPQPHPEPEPQAGEAPRPRPELSPGAISTLEHYSGRFRGWINSGVWCTSVTSTSVSLEWLDLGGATRTMVYYGGSFDAGDWAGDAAELPGATATTATVEGLWQNNSYAFHIGTFGADGEQLERFHTRCSTRNPEFMRCPQTHTTETSLRFAWDPVPDADGYAVVYYQYYDNPYQSASAAFTAGTFVDLDGLKPETYYLIKLFPLRDLAVDDPNSVLASGDFTGTSPHKLGTIAAADAVEAIGHVINDSDVIRFNYGGRSAPYLTCWTLPPDSRCTDVGPTSLTYEWDPYPGVAIYKASIVYELRNGVNNDYWTTHTSWTFDGLVPGQTYRLSFIGYAEAHPDPRDAIAPGRWITDDRTTSLGEVVGGDEFVYHNYAHCTTRGPQ